MNLTKIDTIVYALHFQQVTNTDAVICRNCLKNVISITNFQRKCKIVNEYLISKYQGQGLYFHAPTNPLTTSKKNDFIGYIDLGYEIDHLSQIKFENESTNYSNKEEYGA